MSTFTDSITSSSRTPSKTGSVSESSWSSSTDDSGSTGDPSSSSPSSLGAAALSSSPSRDANTAGGAKPMDLDPSPGVPVPIDQGPRFHSPKRDVGDDDDDNDDDNDSNVPPDGGTTQERKIMKKPPPSFSSSSSQRQKSGDQEHPPLVPVTACMGGPEPTGEAGHSTSVSSASGQGEPGKHKRSHRRRRDRKQVSHAFRNFSFTNVHQLEQQTIKRADESMGYELSHRSGSFSNLSGSDSRQRSLQGEGCSPSPSVRSSLVLSGMGEQLLPLVTRRSVSYTMQGRKISTAEVIDPRATL